jgi:uncharacterized membrane-anchored protein YitT (DUF2179 family)
MEQVKTKKKLTKHEVGQIVKNYALILLGTLFIAIAAGLFLIPVKINSGGLSGIAIIIEDLTGFDPDLTVIIATWTLFLIGLPLLGWRFTLKSLVSTIVYPLLLMLFLRVQFFQDFVAKTFLNEAGEPKDAGVMLVAAIFGGAFTGIGISLTFLSGGSTGGVDILVFILHKYTRVKTSIWTFIVDATVIVLGIFAINNFLLSLIGIIAALMCSLLVEILFVAGKSALTAYIISENKYIEINDFIHNKLERGSTILDIKGGYQHEPRKMILVSFGRNQYAEFINGVAKIDKKAFVIVMQSHEVLGEGFDNLEIPKIGRKDNNE